MANLTVSRPEKRQDGILVDVDLAPTTKVFSGSNVSINAAGFAKKAADTISEIFAGVAMETKDSSIAAESYVRVWKEGVFSMVIAGATQASVGKKVYAVDDNLVALTATNSVLVGTIVGFVSATEVRVKI